MVGVVEWCLCGVGLDWSGVVFGGGYVVMYVVIVFGGFGCVVG